MFVIQQAILYCIACYKYFGKNILKINYEQKKYGCFCEVYDINHLMTL